MLTSNEKTLIRGAAIAVLHQIKLGTIAADPEYLKGDTNNPEYEHIDYLMQCIATGAMPEKKGLVYVRWTDALAHLQQSMRVPYEDWFSLFPWLDGVGRVDPYTPHR